MQSKPYFQIKEVDGPKGQDDKTIKIVKKEKNRRKIDEFSIKDDTPLHTTSPYNFVKVVKKVKKIKNESGQSQIVVVKEPTGRNDLPHIRSPQLNFEERKEIQR